MISEAFVPYFDGIDNKIEPDTRIINMLLEGILDVVEKQERFAAKALELFDHAHYNKRSRLDRRSFMLLIEIFHRIDRKFTMDMMFTEGIK